MWHHRVLCVVLDPTIPPVTEHIWASGRTDVYLLLLCYVHILQTVTTLSQQFYLIVTLHIMIVLIIESENNSYYLEWKRPSFFSTRSFVGGAGLVAMVGCSLVGWLAGTTGLEARIDSELMAL